MVDGIESVILESKNDSMVEWLMLVIILVIWLSVLSFWHSLESP